MNTVEEKVVAIIVEKLSLPREQVTLDSGLRDELAADSLELLELVLAFEDEFGIDIPEAVAREVRTVREIAEKIGAGVAAKAAQPTA